MEILFKIWWFLSGKYFKFKRNLLFKGLIFIFLTIGVNLYSYHFGINADNYNNQLDNPQFRKALKKLNPDFIVWHIAPEDEIDKSRGSLKKIVKFCRKNRIYYLFNTENVNYLPDIPFFLHKDGTKRWDISLNTLKWLKNDKYFLGVVYDEAMLMQCLNHCSIDNREIKPYFVDTKNMKVKEAYEAVVKKIKNLGKYYRRFNKIMVFEMVFPAYAHAVARGGGILAPKMLKENFCDLMYYFYAGAAIEYNSPQLWANIDLWYHDKFPFYGKYKNDGSYHTPQQLFDALKFTYEQGFDYVYIEHVKALIDKNNNLTEFGLKVLEFQKLKSNFKRKKSWKLINPDYIISFFPYGYWGQKYSDTIPDHPYGSWKANKILKQGNIKFLKLLHKLSKGKIPEEADNWNAVLHPYFSQTKYFMFAELPPLLVFDHRVKKFPSAKIKIFYFK